MLNYYYVNGIILFVYAIYKFIYFFAYSSYLSKYCTLYCGQKW